MKIKQIYWNKIKKKKFRRKEERKKETQSRTKANKYGILFFLRKNYIIIYMKKDKLLINHFNEYKLKLN